MSYVHFGGLMFKNKGENGKNNLIGEHIARLRRECVPRMSQRALAERLQLDGLDVDIPQLPLPTCLSTCQLPTAASQPSAPLLYRSRSAPPMRMRD